MYKSELSERLARGMGVSKALARNAVDGVFGMIGEALARDGDARCVRGKTMRNMLDAPFAQVDKCFANGPGRSRRHMINAFVRSSGQYIDHLRDKRLQFLKAVADAEHDDNRNWKVARVLFMRHPRSTVTSAAKP